MRRFSSRGLRDHEKRLSHVIDSHIGASDEPDEELMLLRDMASEILDLRRRLARALVELRGDETYEGPAMSAERSEIRKRYGSV